MILDFDKAMWASGPESVFAPASYRDELERQAQQAVQQERELTQDLFAMVEHLYVCRDCGDLSPGSCDTWMSYPRWETIYRTTICGEAK